MAKIKIESEVVHKVPKDLLEKIKSSPEFIEKWNNLTPLARNEWICWIISVKKTETRKKHIKRTYDEIMEGKKRPCCWPGCPHR